MVITAPHPARRRATPSCGRELADRRTLGRQADLQDAGTGQTLQGLYRRCGAPALQTSDLGLLDAQQSAQSRLGETVGAPVDDDGDAHGVVSESAIYRTDRSGDSIGAAAMQGRWRCRRPTPSAVLA